MNNLFGASFLTPIYVLDTNTLITLFYFYPPEKYPTLWEKFYQMVKNGKITSVREVRRELLQYEGTKSPATNWAIKNINVFPTVTEYESKVAAEILNVPHFRKMISAKKIKRGKPFADPFVIAKAKGILNGYAVTEEVYKRNSGQIPNICEHFRVPCINLEQLIERENMTILRAQ